MLAVPPESTVITTLSVAEQPVLSVQVSAYVVVADGMAHGLSTVSLVRPVEGVHR